MFPIESLVLPCSQASLLQNNALREYFLSVEAMQKEQKSKLRKRRLSFTVLFILLHFIFCDDSKKVEATHVIPHIMLNETGFQGSFKEY